MDALQLRNTVATMFRGTEKVINIPNTEIKISFKEDGNFYVSVHTGKHSGSTFKTKSVKEVVSGLLYYFTPKEGEVYQHINGNVYVVIAIANENSKRAEYPPSVVYQSKNGLCWVKPLENFMHKMNRIK